VRTRPKQLFGQHALDGALAPELAAFVEGGFPFVHISQLPGGDALPVGRRAFFGLPLPVGFVVTAASAGYFVF